MLSYTREADEMFKNNLEFSDLSTHLDIHSEWSEEHAEWQPITSCTLEIFDQSHPLDLN